MLFPVKVSKAARGAGGGMCGISNPEICTLAAKHTEWAPRIRGKEL